MEEITRRGIAFKKLKLSEIKENEYYICCLTNKPVFIKSNKIVSVMGNDAIEGIYYDLGRYRIAEYYDYMLREAR
jgi:hypothetical protein